MAILELKNLTYSYDKKRKVLKGINAQMEAGKMYAILGPSGCGKTTLLTPTCSLRCRRKWRRNWKWRE